MYTSFIHNHGEVVFSIGRNQSFGQSASTLGEAISKFESRERRKGKGKNSLQCHQLPRQRLESIINKMNVIVEVRLPKARTKVLVGSKPFSNRDSIADLWKIMTKEKIEFEEVIHAQHCDQAAFVVGTTAPPDTLACMTQLNDRGRKVRYEHLPSK